MLGKEYPMKYKTHHPCFAWRLALLVFSIAVCGLASEVRAVGPWNVSGTWQFRSNSTPGTLVLHQEPSTLRCKQLTGTLDAGDSGPIIGLYCPGLRRIYFGRHKEGETAPFQMYEGYVADDGKSIAGSFFYWGNEGPVDHPTSPFVATR
jgi:hypothetical protein